MASSEKFHIKEHIVPGQPFRQCHSANTTEEQVIRLSVKQYTPVDNSLPKPGDITIIGAHANAFVKELYEPLWEELVEELRKRGRSVRSIWIADVSNQGASGLLNEDSKYDDVSWYDHPRDLLCMVNQFRTEIVQPVVAIGHSMGATQLAALSVAHPNLFTSLVLIEPIFAKGATIKMGLQLAKGSLVRKIEWPTREIAEKSFKKTFASWDSRVLDRWNRHAIYTTEASDKQKYPPVRLVTSRFAELLGSVSPSLIYDGRTETDRIPWAEDVVLSHNLVALIPRSTIYICGATSAPASAEIRKHWLAQTGTGPYFGRRVDRRRVKEAVVPGVGHFAPMEDPKGCAEAAADWIVEEMKVWEEEDARMVRNWRGLTKEEKEERVKKWMDNLKSKI